VVSVVKVAGGRNKSLVLDDRIRVVEVKPTLWGRLLLFLGPTLYRKY
jgi:hypothetical protein